MTIVAKTTAREITLVLDEGAIASLRQALDDVERGNEVSLGDPGAVLILRPEGWPLDDSEKES